MTVKFAFLLCVAVTLPATSSAALESRDAQDANTPDARLAMEAYGTCVVKLRPKESARVLSMDYKKSSYSTALKMLLKESERPCAQESFGIGRMRGDSLTLAAVIAEALIKAGSEPVNIRLARIGSAKVTPLSKMDAVAHCLARSLPDQVGQLFETAPASDAEVAAATPLLQAVPPCAQATGASEQYELSVLAVRAILATASFRLLAAQEN